MKYMGNFQEDLGDVPGISFQKINSIYGVVYAPLTEVGNLNINTYSYSFIPKCYTYMDLGSLWGVRDYKAAGASLSSAERAGDGHCSY